MNWKPTLRWRRTWPDKPDDFIAKAPEPPGYCRIYLSVHVTHEAGRWYWCAGTWKAAGSGFARTAREAAQRAEEALARQ